MNFKKFKALAESVLLPIPLDSSIVWEDTKEFFTNMIPYVEPKNLQAHDELLPNAFARASFFSLRNCVYTQVRNYHQFGKSFWDE